MTFHVQHVMGSDDYVDHFFPHTDFRTGKRYRLGDVTVAKQPAHGTYDLHIKRQGEEGRWMGDLEDEYRKPKPDWEYRLVPPHKGRFWGLPKDLMQKMEREGLIIYSRVGYPHVKRFMPAGGVPVQDIWVDIPPVTGTDRLYNSQKPKALLERIIATASNPGDIILDPFCGAGATLDAVETLNRQNPEKPARIWIGMEASSLALNLIKYRLGRFYPSAKFKLIGDIKDMRSALLFAARHPLEFQYWAFGLIGARPMGGDKARKGEERQIDGVRYFKDKSSDKLLPILVQVKNGNVKVDDVRGLDGFCRRTKAAMGIFISLQDPTKDAWAEAAACGTYFCQATDQGYPKIQLVNLEDLLKEGRRVNLETVQLPPRHPSEMFK